MSAADRRTEIEATLIIVWSPPDDTRRRIAALRSLAGYRLTARSRVVPHDVYRGPPDAQES